jgi:hypothetical protein
MATIVTRSGKGSPLTNTEVDNNFTNLNDDKLENINSESIEDLSDVNTMTPTDGQLLTWDNANSRWDAADAPVSLPDQTGYSGYFLTTDGSAASWAEVPAGGITYVAKTANYTTQANEGVLADTSGGAFTITLPASPSTGDQVIVADSGGDFGTNNLTVGRNGSTIAGLAEDFTLDINSVSVQLVYDGTTWEVYAQVGGSSGTAVTLDDTQTLTNKTLTDMVIDGAYTEEVYALSGTTPALDPSNGTIQTWTLSANSTPTDSLSAGENITLMIDDGTAYTVTWPTMTWVGGSAPTLPTSGYGIVNIWKVGSTLYGVSVGDA